MAYKAVTCPQCGAAITSIPDRGSFFCQYCGAKIEKEQLNINISGNVTVAGMASVESLLERGYLFLEDRDFDNANKYFERVLDVDPKCSKAYLGKMLAETNNCNTEDFCISYYHQAARNECFQKAVRFANDEEYDKLMAIKQKNIETHNKRLKARQDTLQKAEQMLASFNEYYTKHKYTTKQYQIELTAFLIIAVVYSSFWAIGLAATISTAGAGLILLVPYSIIFWPLIIWGRKIKKKQALGIQLEKDKVKLNQEAVDARHSVEWIIRDWNQ